MKKMDVIKSERITSVQVPGYQEVRVETGRSGAKFLYIGDTFVAFTEQQYRIFVAELYNHK